MLMLMLIIGMDSPVPVLKRTAVLKYDEAQN